MAYGKIQTVATFSDNLDYSNPMTRLNHTTTLATPTEAMTFRAQAGPYSTTAYDDGIRSLMSTGTQDLLGGASIGNVQQTIVTNRSSSVAVYLQFIVELSSATGLVVDVDADGSQGSWARITRNTGTWEFTSDYFAQGGALLQLTTAPSGANSARGGPGKNPYTITDVGDTTLDVASITFSDSTAETISMAILSGGFIKLEAGHQAIIPGSHPKVSLGEGNTWAAWTASGTADLDFMIMGTT